MALRFTTHLKKDKNNLKQSSCMNEGFDYFVIMFKINSILGKFVFITEKFISRAKIFIFISNLADVTTRM